MLQFDPWYHPYPSKRSPIYSQRGMVATSQPLASEAGLEMLKKGGNAVDAAIATAAALTVVEPTSNGIGSDLFAIVWLDGKMHGMNASGRSPGGISIDAVKARGHESVPRNGLIPVNVPGAPGGWSALSEQFGRLSLREVLAPAIRLAEEGFPVSPIVSKHWKAAVHLYPADEPAFKPWFDTFTHQGNAPDPGDVWHFPDHGATLRKIAKTNGKAFYEGEIAERIDHFSREHNGFLRGEDMARFRTDWAQPLSVHYKGYDIWELPPNGQGLVPLMAMNILNGFDLPAKENTEAYHVQMEALKLAFREGYEHITDPAHMRVTPETLLASEYAAEQRALIGEKAIDPYVGTPPRGGTVYLATADGDGNMVSMIQSNYAGFGSGIVIPGTGISMQNRGWEFKLDENAVNALAPNKRTYHTIIPGFLTKGGEPVGPFGVMGGYMMPQGHLQVLVNAIDYGLNPQAALDAPRWKWIGGKSLEVEPHFPAEIARKLVRKGHHIRPTLEAGGFGRGQVIWRNQETGVLVGGTEPRADGHLAIW
ncbi:gamma-glutamyltransferase family protein [Salicibibacter cibi]|uniref:Gamma-glutamyltransferase family protein n=1 Tax=Salicibibacter cibi TaxID=2743001 RepID=A0A7T6Z8C6_9BACI|nr:gamma-glutamyltransferase family protein [Salicibibacter cibi]QQK78729.1 gamma-glutamyltransferase family protein [Salicibibacter cibi]